MGLYGGRPARELTLTDAIMTGFRMAMQPNFVIPILVIGVIVNAIVYAAFVPLIVKLVIGDTDGTGVFNGGLFLSGLVGAVIAGAIGGIVVNLYGQAWATMASVGEPPTMQAAFARVAERWVAILGAGIVVAVVGLRNLHRRRTSSPQPSGPSGSSCSSSRWAWRSTSARA